MDDPTTDRAPVAAPAARLAAGVLLTALLALATLPAHAASPAFAPSLGTLPAADDLDEWERLTRQLTFAETLPAGILAGVMTALTVSMLVDGPPSDAGGWLALPAMASFGLGSVVVGTARGINLQRYRKARAAAEAAGQPWDRADLAAVRRWQARENIAVGVGMLIYAGMSVAMLAIYNASHAERVVTPAFDRGMQIVFVVGITVDLAAGLTQNAMGQRELYWLEREGR